ncbi:uncharacterized protein LOC115874143 isoform X2 [Sitophilus oryzae]|uniref:Uncharacterized protein LOC115874143 isoform X2 n=1 Tax=Sitophilus oryzae TaxID=7048 RepID=A0A6J2X1K0_SITOR|nr:uncharacterized protein LOC115874143 isoform X2 [Sitophilus oryzae]
MKINENIFDKIKRCRECKKFLSVKPIKVYPNGLIKCGRCSKDNNNGVESKLYEMVLKNTLFPCVNSYEGCEESHTIDKMLDHENICLEGQYDCFLCCNFKGPAYLLDIHCKEYHKLEYLENLEFVLDVNSCTSTICYFHSRFRKLFFIKGSYDAENTELQIDLIYVGKLFKGEVKYQVKIYSVNNELKYESPKNYCSVMELILGDTVKINIQDLNLSQSMVVCKFIVETKPYLQLSDTTTVTVIDPFLDSYLLKCPFYNIMVSGDPEKFEYPSTFYFRGIIWKVYIKIKKSLIDKMIKFGIYMQWHNTDSNPIEYCVISAIFNVIGVNASNMILKKTKKVDKEKLSLAKSIGVIIGDYKEILDPDGIFYINKCINVEIQFKIHTTKIREIKCEDCQRPCACNSVNV